MAPPVPLCTLPSRQRAPGSPRPCGRAPAPFGERGAADGGRGHPFLPTGTGRSGPALPRARRSSRPVCPPPPRSPALRAPTQPGTRGSGPCGGSASASAATAHGSPRRAASEHVRAPGMRSAGGEAAALPPPSPAAVSSAGRAATAEHRQLLPPPPPPSSSSSSSPPLLHRRAGWELGRAGPRSTLTPPRPLRPSRSAGRWKKQEQARADYIVRDNSILLISFSAKSVRVPVA